MADFIGQFDSLIALWVTVAFSSIRYFCTWQALPFAGDEIPGTVNDSPAVGAGNFHCCTPPGQHCGDGRMGGLFIQYLGLSFYGSTPTAAYILYRELIRRASMKG